MNPRFSAFAGQLGTAHQGGGMRFAPSANPWANVVAGFPAQSAVPPSIVLFRPVAATATIAGRAGIGCCGGCAADHRKA
jgi:hypothetical protein